MAQQWGLSVATVYQWLQEFLVERLNSLPYRWGGGRKSKLTQSQKRRLCQLLDAGPLAGGVSGGGWSSVMVAELISKQFGVLYNRFYVCTLLPSFALLCAVGFFVGLKGAKRGHKGP